MKNKIILIFVFIIFSSGCAGRPEIVKPDTTRMFEIVKSQQTILSEQRKMLKKFRDAQIEEMYELKFIEYELGRIDMNYVQLMFKVNLDLNKKFWRQYIRTLNLLNTNGNAYVCANYRLRRTHDKIKLIGTKYNLHHDLINYIVKPKKANVVININGVDFFVPTIIYDRFYNLQSLQFPGCKVIRNENGVIGNDGLELILTLYVNPKLIKYEPRIQVRLEEVK